MKLGFVFPGQGSQSVGMLSELAAEYPVVKETFTEASRKLEVDLWEISQQGPTEKLNQTQLTQPAMLAAGVAVWRVWQQYVALHDLQPIVFAGHSLGEYTALVCAGSLDLASAAQLVSDRGLYMQDAAPVGEGTMAAILGLDDNKVISACEQAAQTDVVAAVNFNSPGQVVIAGQVEAVKRAMDICKQSGAKRVLELPVSVPSHCQLMDPAAHQLAERLQQITINPPRISIISNVDVSTVSESKEIKDLLTRQLCNPVRWVETIEKMLDDGVSDIVECGPGKVLTGLTKRINKSVNSYAVFSPDSLQKTVDALKTKAG
ncbi:MAG: ACP S-malonyltransferase [Thiohalomonadales bacterium]